MSALPDLPAPVAATLARWHEMVETLDLSDVGELLHPDVKFSSPAFWKPYPGPVVTAHVLQTAMRNFTDFAYHRSFATGDGHDVVLEFSARIGELELEGVDMIAFAADGAITHFEVMIRPMKSLAALAERMGATLDLSLMGKA